MNQQRRSLRLTYVYLWLLGLGLLAHDLCFDFALAGNRSSSNGGSGNDGVAGARRMRLLQEQNAVAQVRWLALRDGWASACGTVLKAQTEVAQEQQQQNGMEMEYYFYFLFLISYFLFLILCIIVYFEISLNSNINMYFCCLYCNE